MPTAVAAAGASLGQVRGGHDEVAGLGVPVARGAGGEGPIVLGEDLGPAWMTRSQPAGIGLAQRPLLIDLLRRHCWLSLHIHSPDVRAGLGSQHG